ncbi:MAG: hypothetical protein VW450_08300 [Chloroflexota bacterium]
MQVMRVYTGKDGRSHFEDVELDFDASAGRFPRALMQDAHETGFNFQPGGFQDSMHTAPYRRMVIILSGGVDIVLSGGDHRQVGPGDVIIFEDTTGEGHIMNPIGDEPRYSAYVALEDPQARKR